MKVEGRGMGDETQILDDTAAANMYSASLAPDRIAQPDVVTMLSGRCHQIAARDAQLSHDYVSLHTHHGPY